MNSKRTVLVLALVGALAAPVVLAQTCNPNIRPSAPDTRYIIDTIKGTVLDRQTGLTWKRCVEGLSGPDCGAGPVTPLSWGPALNQAAGSDFAGYKDWRLPNAKELESLVEVACSYPALNATAFPSDPSSSVWTSSYSESNEGGRVRQVNFGHGGQDSSYAIYASAVRLVRGGR